MKGFDFEEERIKQEITKLCAKRVLLQLPEGLKLEAPKIAQVIENAGALPIISADPCYGACDLAVCDAETLGVDLIVHFGHAKMVHQEAVPALYVEARATVPVEAAVEQALPLLVGFKKVGLATSVQHLQTLARAREILANAGKTVFVGGTAKIAYAGQVSGCNYSNATSIVSDVEAFLFVGGGVFHALGIALSTGKPTVIADPYDNRAFLVNEQAEKMLKQRFAGIQEAKNAKTFGVVVGLKPGQQHLETALKLKEVAQKHGKTAVVLAGREITPEVLLEFPSIDAYVNTACPRISLEATSKFSKPVLTVGEFKVAIGEVEWQSILNGGLFEN